MKAGYGVLHAMPGTGPLEQIRSEGNNRLYPSITNPNWLVLRKRREIFTRWLRQIDLEDRVVLDVGGRIQPYRPLISQHPSLHIAVDLVVTPLVDVIGNAVELPIRSDCVDFVLCTQMLEYVPEPREVIDEIYRVLRPGGYLLLSAPAVYPRDSENDYWRFLDGALRDLLAHFSTVDLIAEGSSLAGFIRTINVCLISFTPVKMFRTLLSLTVVPLLNLFGVLLEHLEVTKDTSFSANFSVLARK